MGKRKGAFLITRQGLTRLRSRACKNGAWYEALSKTERAIVDLTIRCVETIRSPILSRAITKIVGKLSQTLQKTFQERAQEIGAVISKRITEIAQNWGNKKSSEWETDDNFIKFLGVTALNT
jgi:5-carboxymethyl-2-hydroxymuconate isomerase